MEVRLEDRLEDQLQAGLHNPVPDRRDAQTPELARRLWDHLLLDRERFETAGFELSSQPVQHRFPEDNGTCSDAIDPSRSCSSIPSHPIPRNQQKRRIGNKVKQVIEPTTVVVV